MVAFYDKEAERYYKKLKEDLNDKNTLDDDLLVTYANLRSQEYELQIIIKDEGYRTTNVNSRGKETFQINPTYRAYLSCVAEKSKTYSKLCKLLPELGGEQGDGFDSF